MESGFCVVKMMSSQQRFLNGSSDDHGPPSEYSTTPPFESSLSNPRRECLQETQVSKESFGEVQAAIPFNWEVVPGRPKLQSSMKNSGSSQGGGGGGVNEVFDEPLRLMPSSRRPLACRSSSGFHLGARFQAEMLATSSTVGNSRAEDWVPKLLRDRRPLACQSSSAFHLSPGFQAEILATSSVGCMNPEENFVIGQLLPLPPRLRTPKLHRIAPDSSDAFPQYVAGKKNTRGGVVDHQMPERIHGSYHRRARSLHTPIERPGKEATSTTTLESEFGVAGDDGPSPKLMWPFLRDKIRWRSSSDHHHHHHLPRNNFAQNVVTANNEVVLDHSKENFRILDASPQLLNIGVSSKSQLEKENDGPKLLLSTAFFRKLAAAIPTTTTSGSKSVPYPRRTSSRFSTRSAAAIIPHDDLQETQSMPAARGDSDDQETISHDDTLRAGTTRSSSSSYSSSKPHGRSRSSTSTRQLLMSHSCCFALISSPRCSSCHGFHGFTTPGYQSP